MPLKVHFYGDGPDRRMLENLIHALNVDAYFEFRGYVADQKEIYSHIDACILASRTEVAPLVLMECLVRNIPVVAADLDGCKEILSNFYDDLFFEQGNDESLALKLEFLLRGNALQNLRERIRIKEKRIITRDYQVNRVYEFLAS
jgi:glycosyltransferase involved in cell wall biosynthesis